MDEADLEVVAAHRVEVVDAVHHAGEVVSETEEVVEVDLVESALVDEERQEVDEGDSHPEDEGVIDLFFVHVSYFFASSPDI